MWISDDGGWANGGVRIATNEFTLTEVTLLANILRSKFALDVTIQIISSFRLSRAQSLEDSSKKKFSK